MSVEAIAIALHHSRAVNATQALVLVGIANHSGDGGAWPTVATLARYARVERRRVQSILVELERMGEIRRDIQSGGTSEIAHYDRPNLYHFLLACPRNCDRTPAHKLLCEGCGKPIPKGGASQQYHLSCEPQNAAQEGVSPTTPGVAHDTRGGVVQNARGVSPTTPKPSLELPPRLKEETHVIAREVETENDTAGAVPLQVADAPENDASGDAPSIAFEIGAAVDRATTAHAHRLSNSIDPDELCPRRAEAPHAYSKAGRCIDCGAPSPAVINPNTGEIE